MYFEEKIAFQVFLFDKSQSMYIFEPMKTISSSLLVLVVLPNLGGL